MRSPSNAMLRSPARSGHGSTIWVTLLAATASPAAKLTVSRRSRYMSVQAPSNVVAASARIAPRMLLRDDLARDIALSLGNVEDVADRRLAAVRDALEAPLHRYRDFRLAEQEEFRIVRGARAVERRAQHVAGTGRAHEARGDDDDEIGFFLLIRRAARERAEDRHVGKPGQLLLVGRVDRLPQSRERQTLPVAQFDCRVGAAHDERRDGDRTDRDRRGRIDLTDFRLDLEV